MGASQKHDKSKGLKEMPVKPPRALPAEEEEHEGAADEGLVAREPLTAPDTVVQAAAAAAAMPSTALNFNGIAFPGVTCFCAPPDTNGEVGATQYVQSVNDGYQVFDKTTGASVYGPASIGSIWQGFGGVCETNGDGDPVVLYDQLANRWLVSQFAGANVPTDECVAVSTSSDAAGSYFRYDFALGSNFMDYPHGAVWPDGYYFSFNVFNSAGTSYLGPQPVVFDRTKMLAGQAATYQTRTPLGGTVDPFLPADLDGSTLPPAGAPASFVKWPGNGTYQTYHYHVDWVTPGNSTFTSFASPAAAGFTQLCLITRNCVPQPGTTTRLDGIGDRLMFRLAYRNFGDHESVVGNFTVSSGSVAGIRWFELRNVTAGPVTVYQQSTYQPDSTWRWMGSIAMDKAGDIALGYSASSSTVNPSLRYAGRLTGDALGSLGQGEATLFAGLGSQSGTSNRWGDYADMTIDPVDDCTFWFTSEYYPAGVSQFNWRTRIGSFSFPSCGGGGPTTGSISGHVTDAVSSAAIGGATVSISGGPSTTTDASGAYSFSSLAPASYDLTASKAGYASSTNSGVTVTAGNTATSDFALTPNASTTTPFAYATTSVAGPGGDRNGYETNRSALWGAPNGAFATDVNSGKNGGGSGCTSGGDDKEVASGNALGSLGSSILGIQVQLTGSVNATAGSPRYCVQLSSDGGSTWTAAKQTLVLTTSTATYLLGGTADTWGRSWTAADFGSGLRVRIIDSATSNSLTFSLDSVGVSVTYQ
jgi:hypothetical protein